MVLLQQKYLILELLAAPCLKNKMYKISVCCNIEIRQQYSAQGSVVINTAAASSYATFLCKQHHSC